MANPNIYAQYAQPVRSVQDYADQLDMADTRRQQNALQRLLMQRQMQADAAAADEQNALAALWQGMPQDASPQQRAEYLMRNPRTYGQGVKAYGDVAEADQKRATGGKSDAEATKVALANYRGLLDMVDSPQRAGQWVKMQYDDPRTAQVMRSMGTLDEALAAIPRDPAGFQKWRELNAMGMEKYISEERQRFEAEQRARNDMIGPDGKPNMPVIAAKSAVAKAGATNVGVSVATERGYSGRMAQGLAEQDLAVIDAARGAPERARSAREVLRILETEKPITGSLAEQRLAIDKALSTAGVVDGKSVESTENLVSLLASQTLDAIKTSGLGSGQGFTDKDRAFLEKARSGNITINADTLKYLARLNERSALASVAKGRKVAERVKNDPNFGSVGQTLLDELGPEFKPPTAQEIEAEARRRGLKGR